MLSQLQGRLLTPNSNSGAAYSLTSFDSDEKPEIEVLHGWPHGTKNEYRDASEKVPSEIAYDKVGKPKGYGFDIPEDSIKPLWVKLLLDPNQFDRQKANTDEIWRSMNALDHIGKKPIVAVADYLTWFWQRIQEKIIKHEDNRSIFQTAEVTVVLTVPASWSDKAKDRILQAATKAGIADEERKIKLVAEPEAAAIHGLKSKAQKRQVAAGDVVIICDAGGGTVDVVSYQIKSIKPLMLDQCVISQGDFCGSVFVGFEFEKQLQSILGSDLKKLTKQAVAKILDDFEYKIKRTYNLENPEAYEVDVPGLEDDLNRGIKNGKLCIDSATLQASFDSIMTQIMALIDGQEEALKHKGLANHLKGILLIGGFGGSEYLHTRIRQEYPEEEEGSIKIWQSDRSWTSVVRGAVLSELSGPGQSTAIHRRMSSYNYGVVWKQGGVRQVQWLIRKGQAVEYKEQIEPYQLRMVETDYLDTDRYVTIIIDLLRTEDDNAPDIPNQTGESPTQIKCRIPTSIRRRPETVLVQDHPKVWSIPAELVLVMDSTLPSIRCRILGEDVGRVDLSYDTVSSRTPSTSPGPRDSVLSNGPDLITEAPEPDRRRFSGLTAVADLITQGPKDNRRPSSTKSGSKSPARSTTEPIPSRESIVKEYRNVWLEHKQTLPPSIQKEPPKYAQYPGLF